MILCLFAQVGKMVEQQTPFLIFSGFDGLIADQDTSAIAEVFSTLDLLRSRNIPLIITTDRTSEEIFPTLLGIRHRDPFIVENGGAIYIPEGALTIPFNYKRIEKEYKVIEFGIGHDSILQHLERLRHRSGFQILGLSEMSPTKASDMGSFTLEEIRSIQARNYSEPALFGGNSDEFQNLKLELESSGLRITQRGNYHLITGDHDAGSAIRFLIQLYREEWKVEKINTIGLGDNYIDAPMLHAVDQPVLVRKPNGKFDSQVGRRGLRFTRFPGLVGWSQAIIALVTGKEE